MKILKRVFREVLWSISLLKPSDILNLGLWIMVLSGLNTAYHYNQLATLSGSASHIGKSTSIASVTTAQIQTIKELPSGPSGQIQPPSNMAPAYTYANSYVPGQCTWYVAGRRKIPNNWGDARTWYLNAQIAHWPVGSIPTVGAIAWTPAGPRGHVMLVEATENGQVLISEMNYIGPYKLSKRWVSNSSFKYIY
jgi:surface antigen